jgi:hypothetical protein
MIIPHTRLIAAARRIAPRALDRNIREGRFPIYLTPAHCGILIESAYLPYAVVKLSQRLWMRGHIVMDTDTREIFRGRPSL